jgi:long-chain acyl-CoA synthetase
MDILSRFSCKDPGTIPDQASLEGDLGLSSLDRVELVSLLEERFGLDLDEQALTGRTTIEELKRLTGSGRVPSPSGSSTRPVETPSPAPQAIEVSDSTAEEPSDAGPKHLPLPGWNRRLPARLLRGGFQEGLLLPSYRLFMGLSVCGTSQLNAVSPPVIFAANHTSHGDTLAIVDALPWMWRRRLAPAMMQEYFTPLLKPEQYGLGRRLGSRGSFLLLCLLLNAYPLPQRMGGVRRVLRYTGEIVENGQCPLIYPEGSRTPDGAIHSFQAGVGLMARQLDLPVVPIRLQGLFELFSKHHSRPKPGLVRVTFGQPMAPGPDTDPASFSRELERRIRQLGQGSRCDADHSAASGS